MRTEHLYKNNLKPEDHPKGRAQSGVYRWENKSKKIKDDSSEKEPKWVDYK